MESFKEILKKWEDKKIEEFTDEDFKDINKNSRKLDTRDNFFKEIFHITNKKLFLSKRFKNKKYRT